MNRKRIMKGSSHDSAFELDDLNGDDELRWQRGTRRAHQPAPEGRVPKRSSQKSIERSCKTRHAPATQQTRCVVTES